MIGRELSWAREVVPGGVFVVRNEALGAAPRRSAGVLLFRPWPG